MDAPTGRRTRVATEPARGATPPTSARWWSWPGPGRGRLLAGAAIAVALAAILGLLAGPGPVASAATPAGGVPALDAAEVDERSAGVADGAPDDQVGGGRSFASAFFISRKLGAAGSEPRLELLGSAVIWLLLLLSIGSLGLIGQLAATNRRAVIMPPTSFTAIRDLLRSGRYREAIAEAERDGSFFAEVLASALREAGHGWDSMVHALDQRTDELVADRQRRIEVLNVLGQVSPMIGLFGTVYGMILAFQSIVSAGGAADPVMLAGGIGTALTTTFWGLVVAIPALTGYAIVRALMDARTAEAALAAEELVGLFRPPPETRARGGGGGAQRRPGEGAQRRPRGPEARRGSAGEGDGDGDGDGDGGGAGGDAAPGGSRSERGRRSRRRGG